jgi:type VI secretion system protein ImpA
VSFPLHSLTDPVFAKAVQPALPEWAVPFPGGTCGPNLEYDPEFLALQQLALGRPETQFEAAVPADWPAVEKGAVQLLGRSRDLRVAVLWLEARLHLEGLACLPIGFNALASLLENAWFSINPPLDEGDPYARLNVIESLGPGGSFFVSLRNCRVVQHARIGELRLKDFEAITGAAESVHLPYQRDQVEQFLRSPEGCGIELTALLQNTVIAIEHLQAVLAKQVDAILLPSFKAVKSLLGCVMACLPFNGRLPEMDASQAVTVPLDSTHTRVPATGSTQPQSVLFPPVASREQALAAIRQVCTYLESAEPTNPAPLLLNRACQLMDKPFLQLIRQLAPDALSEVARVMGIHPDSLEQHDH